jgi:hypothetical protein
MARVPTSPHETSSTKKVLNLSLYYFVRLPAVANFQVGVHRLLSFNEDERNFQRRHLIVAQFGLQNISSLSASLGDETKARTY